MKIITRDVPPRAAWALEQSGLHPLLARLFAARGISQREELDDALAQLLTPSAMKGADEAARTLADAMAAKRRICIVADYDCDGDIDMATHRDGSWLIDGIGVRSDPNDGGRPVPEAYLPESPH